LIFPFVHIETDPGLAIVLHMSEDFQWWTEVPPQSYWLWR